MNTNMSNKETRQNSKKSNNKLKTSKASIENFEKILFKKNKFKFSDNFDEKNSESFLSNINYYLQEICLDDKIHKRLEPKTNFKCVSDTSNNKLKYHIVVTNYDENIKKNKKK